MTEQDAQDKAWEEDYEKYLKTRALYEQLIDIEEDSQRRKMLDAMLGDLNEENK